MSEIELISKSGTKLLEYGLAGALMLVIVIVMGLLLRFVLTQANEDRKMWAAQAEKFSQIMDGFSRVLIVISEKLGRIEDVLDEFRTGEQPALAKKR
jgi:hypothetical protein